MSSVLLGLRLGRWGVVGFSLLGFATTFTQAVAYYALAGHTLAQQAAFGAAVGTLATHFTAILPPPVRPDTVGGYVEWRGFQALGVLFGVWALASATGVSRVDEERGVVEAVLAAGTSRVAWAAARVTAFSAAALVASIASSAGYAIAVVSHHDSLDVAGIAEQTLLLAVLAVAVYSIALLVSQLVSPRTATAAAGAVILALFMVNSLSRTFASLATPALMSPFHYFDINQPLPPGGAFDPKTVVVMLAMSVITAAAAGVAFSRRDLGAAMFDVPGLPHASGYDAPSGPWWRAPVGRELYERRAGLVAWAAGVAALGIVFVFLTRTAIQPLLALPAILPYFTALIHGDIFPAMLGYIWFSAAQLLFAAFAITQVGRWAAEDSDGRLEMLLSQPRSRASVMVERMATMAAGAAVVAIVSGVAVFYASRSQGVELDQQRLAAASLMLVPFALVFASAGALLTAWKPRAAVGLLGAVAFASYLDTEVGALLRWPVWVQDLSAFRLFGTPLTSGVDGRNLAIMLLIAGAALGSSILAMQRRDVGA